MIIFGDLPLKLHFEECNGGIPVPIFLIEKRNPCIEVVEDNIFHLLTMDKAKVDHFMLLDVMLSYCVYGT